MLYLRQGATHKVVVGPVVAVGDGFTPVTTLALSTADEAEAILHDNGTVVDISGYTWAAITTADGYYHLTLQSGISGTVGHMTVVVNDDSLCLPVKAEFTIVEEAVYDAFFAASATGVPAAGALEATSQSILTDTGTTLDDLVDDLESRLGTPSDLGSGATIAANLVDIEAQTDDIGTAGAGLTAVPWNAAWDAEVESEVNDAINTAIAELGVGAPTATPTIRTAIMLMYMALRNKLVVQTSGTDAIEIYNDAGTKIAAKTITDDGSDYTEDEMA